MTLNGIEIKITDLPLMINRVIEGNSGNFKFKVMVTDNILLPSKDADGKDLFEVNVYKQFLKVVGKATDGSMGFKWESPIIDRDEIELFWRKYVNEFFDAIKDKYKIAI